MKFFHILEVLLALYQRMPMGLNISPSMWQSFINVILDHLQSKRYCEAIMDYLLLFTPPKRFHIAKLEDLLQALLKNGLKISPKKCQLFRETLQYMGNEIFIQNKTVCVKPLRSRSRSNSKIAFPPLQKKGCRSFVEMVNSLGIFLPSTTKAIKSNIWPNQKRQTCVWGKETTKFIWGNQAQVI